LRSAHRAGGGEATLYEQVTSNKRRSWLLVVAFVGFIVVLGIAFNAAIGYGPVGILIAVVVALALAFGSYWKSDSIALSMSRAEPADPVVYARLHNLVDGLCIASGLPRPRLYVVNDPAPNAFATGRNPRHAAIAVTTGLLEKMNRVELEGVLAHELSHIKNYDILVSTLAVTMVGAAALMSDFGIRMLWFGGARRGGNDSGTNPLIGVLALMLIVLAPVIARLMQLALSRRRESLADMSAIEMTRYPPGLIAALEKLKADSTVVATGNRATAHLWIEEPVPHRDDTARASRWTHLFDTHPPLDERISALREL
jgi:heat shock protein HtpX